MAINLKDILEGLGEGWVALSDDYSKVISHHIDIKVTIRRAAEQGYDDPILFRIPKDWLPVVCLA